MEKIEYRVRPVTRFVVTRFHQMTTDKGDSAGCETRGEFDNFDTAHAVAYALADADTKRLGLPPGDESVTYPDAHPYPSPDNT